MRKIMFALALCAALGLIAGSAFAQGAGKAKQKQAAVQLTAEQRTQLQAKLKELHAANAKQEEINTAIGDLYKGWGLEPPKGRALVMMQLTPEQRKQVRAKQKEMKAANATTQEIKTAVTEMLTGWGYELPQAAGERKGKNVDDRLTAEQREQLRAKMKELRAAKAKPEEIKAAIAALYQGWGLEPPQREEGPRLTKEQRAELQAKIKEMKAAGAKPAEIKAAVAELYRKWGVEMPQKEGRKGKGDVAPEGMKQMLDGLTEEQRQQVLAKVDEMQKAGATQDEIKAKVTEMVKAFGEKK